MNNNIKPWKRLILSPLAFCHSAVRSARQHSWEVFCDKNFLMVLLSFGKVSFHFSNVFLVPRFASPAIFFSPCVSPATVAGCNLCCFEFYLSCSAASSIAILDDSIAFPSPLRRWTLKPRHLWNTPEKKERKIPIHIFIKLQWCYDVKIKLFCLAIFHAYCVPSVVMELKCVCLALY